jgi:hypothetical protein
MPSITRREFTAAGLAALGATMLPGDLSAAEAAAPASAPQKLPTVRWGKHEITRLLVGHNPIKGTSHFSKELDGEMKEYFTDQNVHGRQMLRRCEEVGINTCQMGAPAMEALLRSHYAAGGKMQWIATFYSAPGKGKEELARILKMDPKPIGAQHFGATTDRLMRQGKIDEARDTLKMFRDAGLLVGLCSHNHEVIDYAENKGWDVDFYQGSFYHSTDGLKPTQPGEVFEESARQSMAKTLGQVSKPCIAFKVLAGNRHCTTPAAVEAAIRFAFKSIKPTDVVLLGMWHKYKDQAGENAGYARKILGVA